MENEKWKFIKGHEKKYKISSNGKVYSLYRKKCLKQFKFDGYNRIRIKDKHYRTARLVATYFVPNPNNYPVVNHINSIRDDDRAENLEWCTQSHNVLHSYENGNKKYYGKKSSRYKHVSWNKNAKKWCSFVGRNGEDYYIGYYEDEFLAHLASSVFVALTD